MCINAYCMYVHAGVQTNTSLLAHGWYIFCWANNINFAVGIVLVLWASRQKS